MTKGLTYKKYIDAETGEVIDVPQMFHKKPKNYDFDMIFYGHLLEILNDLGNKKIQVLQYIIKNREKANNTFIGTVRDIANALEVSIFTVQSTLVLLEDKEVIKRKTGVIYINSDLVCDGRFKGHIMHVYGDVKDELSAEERKAKVEREIKRKEAELKDLERIKNNIVIEPKNQVSMFQ